MKIPNIQDYVDSRLFLTDLYDMNRKESGVGSYRYFAKRLSWPVSYMSDVIHSRKKLTVTRAIELGSFLKLDTLDIERLIYLVLQDCESELVSSFFKEKVALLNSSFNFYQEGTLSHEKISDDYVEIGEEIYSDNSLTAIREVISWKNGNCQLQEISDLLYSFSELRSLDILEQKIKKLERHGLLEVIYKDEKIFGFKKPQKGLIWHVNRENCHYLKQYADNLKFMLSDSRGRGMVGSSIFTLSKLKALELRKRIYKLRNWIHIASKESSEVANEKDSLVFQFDLNLLLLLDSKLTGVESLADWMNS